MESMRASWTDSRLDDFANRTDRRFDDLEHRIDVGFARVDHDFRELRSEIGGLQRTILQIGGGMIAAILGLMAAVIGLIATQL
jgi:hypothetical protein